MDDSDPAPYVTNDGAPFSSANFLAVIGFGLSNKSAGEGIGNKGLGFRSVLWLTDRPEVCSRDPDDPADRGFSGAGQAGASPGIPGSTRHLPAPETDTTDEARHHLADRGNPRTP